MLVTTTSPSLAAQYYQAPPLTNDLILKIFDLFIRQLRQNVVCTTIALRLVCKDWKHNIDSRHVGQWIFDRLKWKFPLTETKPWQILYRDQMGDCFQGQPTIKKISYIDDLNLNFLNRVIWIEDKGFIAFTKWKHNFTIRMLDAPNEPITVACGDEIFSILTLQDLILCGLKNGEVVGYTLKGALAFQKAAHEKQVKYLFSYQEGWISICEQKIVYWNKSYEPKILLSVCMSSLGVTSLNKCYLENHYLFFKYYLPTSSIDQLAHYSFSLDPLGVNLEAIASPNYFGEIDDHPHVYVWGDELATIQEQSIRTSSKGLKPIVIRRFPFSHQFFFSKPQNPAPFLNIWVNRINPEHHTKRDYFFRGNALVILVTHLFLEKNQYHEYQRIHFVDLCNLKEHTLEISSPLDGQKTVLFNHRLCGISLKTKKIIIIEFIN